MFRIPLIESLVRGPADEGKGAPAASDTPADAGKPADAPAKDNSPGALLYSADKQETKPDEQAKPAEGEAKPDADKAKEPDAAKPEDKAAAEAKLKEIPEDGKYEFALPDGVEIDTELAATAMPVLKEAGVSREGANKLAAFMAQQRATEHTARMEHWDKINREWQDAARKDSEYGGDKFDASLGAANKMIDKFGTPELKEYLTASGGGNHPEMIRFMARVGNAFSDDKPIGSKPVSEKSDDPVKTLYS
jgi:hypothetical protein